MTQTLTLCDQYGIIYQAMKILPDNELKIAFLEALAELEDNECHRTKKFPRTRVNSLHLLFLIQQNSSYSLDHLE